MPRVSSQVYLWIAVILFAASNSFVRKLNEIGEQHLISGRNPISPCNILFVSNICALLVLSIVNYNQLNLKSLKQISQREWLALVVVAILSGTLTPGFLFQALTLTKVTNIILIGRIEPLLILAISIWFFREVINRWEIIGAFTSFLGVIIIFGLSSIGAESTITFGQGEFLMLIGLLTGIIGNIISKIYLNNLPPFILTIMRMLIATIAFFWLAIYLYGSQHFAEAFSPFLWEWMLVYGAVIVALGQFLWAKGIKDATLSEASLAGSFSPIVGVISAYLILNEKLMFSDYVGGFVIIIGLVLSQIGIRQKTLLVERINTMNNMREAEMGLGFKGV